MKKAFNRQISGSNPGAVYKMEFREECIALKKRKEMGHKNFAS